MNASFPPYVHDPGPQPSLTVADNMFMSRYNMEQPDRYVSPPKVRTFSSLLFSFPRIFTFSVRVFRILDLVLQVDLHLLVTRHHHLLLLARPLGWEIRPYPPNNLFRVLQSSHVTHPLHSRILCTNPLQQHRHFLLKVCFL